MMTYAANGWRLPHGLGPNNGSTGPVPQVETMTPKTNAGAAPSGTVRADVRPAGPEESTYIRWIWNYPSCGGRTVSMRDQNETREAIEADPLCHKCRRPNASRQGRATRE
jgi:hypothetical protein